MHERGWLGGPLKDFHHGQCKYKVHDRKIIFVCALCYYVLMCKFTQIISVLSYHLAGMPQLDIAFIMSGNKGKNKDGKDTVSKGRVSQWHQCGSAVSSAKDKLLSFLQEDARGPKRYMEEGWYRSALMKALSSETKDTIGEFLASVWGREEDFQTEFEEKAQTEGKAEKYTPEAAIAALMPRGLMGLGDSQPSSKSRCKEARWQMLAVLFVRETMRALEVKLFARLFPRQKKGDAFSSTDKDAYEEAALGFYDMLNTEGVDHLLGARGGASSDEDVHYALNQAIFEKANLGGGVKGKGAFGGDMSKRLKE